MAVWRVNSAVVNLSCMCRVGHFLTRLLSVRVRLSWCLMLELNHRGLGKPLGHSSIPYTTMLYLRLGLWDVGLNGAWGTSRPDWATLA